MNSAFFVNDLAILRVVVAGLRYLLIDDAEIAAATAVLNRKLFEYQATLQDRGNDGNQA